MTVLAVPPVPESAHRAYARHEHSFLVARPPTEAFVLFEPAGEKLWAEGWRPVFATDTDARLHDGSVFTLDYPNPGGSPRHSVWSVARYAPPRRIEYRNVLIGLRATEIAIRCEPAADNATKVTVRYTYHSLSDDGDRSIAKMTAETYRADIDTWAADIAAYLKRGTPATP